MALASNSLHLKSISLRPLPEDQVEQFPFSIPVIRSLGTLEFATPVTFFVGENGSGKSTLLEALACAVDLPAVGSESLRHDRSLAQARRLSNFLRLSWTKRVHKGFFLRAEDFFGYARRMVQARQELEEDLRDVDASYRDRPEAIDYARMPYQHELGDIQHRYGDGLDSLSHGEAFLRLFQSRFIPGGLYLLDEPEVPLSPVRQLALLASIDQMVQQQAQFIIATHSPILMAFPGAVIYSFDTGRILPVDYEALEHVTLTRSFLNDPQAYLRRLLEE